MKPRKAMGQLDSAEVKTRIINSSDAPAIESKTIYLIISYADGVWDVCGTAWPSKEGLLAFAGDHCRACPYHILEITIPAIEPEKGKS